MYVLKQSDVPPLLPRVNFVMYNCMKLSAASRRWVAICVSLMEEVDVDIIYIKSRKGNKSVLAGNHPPVHTITDGLEVMNLRVEVCDCKGNQGTSHL